MIDLENCKNYQWFQLFYNKCIRRNRK